MSKIDVLNVAFDNVTMDEAVDTAYEAIKSRTGGFVVTPNPEIIMLAKEDPAFAEVLCQAQLVLPDGIGVIYGAKILGTPLVSRVPGIDFAAQLMQRLAEDKRSVFLFGAKPGVAEQAGKKLQENYPGLDICGTCNGYFDDDAPIIAQINEAKPDLLLVCLGAPKQEFWMRDHASDLDVGLIAGLGGSLDVFAGVVQRAPHIWQKLGLEWLYRLLKEPSRIGRMMKLPKFLVCIIKKRVTK